MNHLRIIISTAIISLGLLGYTQATAHTTNAEDCTKFTATLNKMPLSKHTLRITGRMWVGNLSLVPAFAEPRDSRTIFRIKVIFTKNGEAGGTQRQEVDIKEYNEEYAGGARYVVATFPDGSQKKTKIKIVQ